MSKLNKFEIEESDGEESCLDCLFWRASAAGSHGFCRRFPPVFTETDAQGRPKFWNPVTGPHGWCGEWEPLDALD